MLRELTKVNGKINTVLPPVEDKDGDSLLDDAAYCWWAKRFCEALGNGDYKFAHQYKELSDDPAYPINYHYATGYTRKIMASTV